MSAILYHCLPDHLFALHAFAHICSVDPQPVMPSCSFLPLCRITIAQDPSLFLLCLILALTSVGSLKCKRLNPFTTSLLKICDLITYLSLFSRAVTEVFWYNLTFPASCLPIRSVVLSRRNTNPKRTFGNVTMIEGSPGIWWARTWKGICPATGPAQWKIPPCIVQVTAVLPHNEGEKSVNYYLRLEFLPFTYKNCLQLS